MRYNGDSSRMWEFDDSMPSNSLVCANSSQNFMLLYIVLIYFELAGQSSVVALVRSVPPARQVRVYGLERRLPQAKSTQTNSVSA